MSEGLDRRFMAAAIRLGASANGTTWPNPAVGAIVVKDGVVISRGRTRRGGRPHGEALALGAAGEGARGATMYVSLEPCSHQGREGPCADAIIAAGVSRVVAAMVDPDLRIAGKGFERLHTAQIDVVSGNMATEAARTHAGHLSRVRSSRPHVLLKLAVSADDAIGRVGEPKTEVTGETARRQIQALRSRFDAIIVGRGTAEADDPELTVRLPGLQNRSPVRVLLDSNRMLSDERRVFSAEAPTWVFSAKASGPERNGIRRFKVSMSENGLDLAECLKRLADEGITRLLVEGGARIARSFLEADFIDEVMLFRSPKMLGGSIVAALAGLPLSTVEASPKFSRIERRRFGADMMSRYERVR